MVVNADKYYLLFDYKLKWEYIAHRNVYMYVKYSERQKKKESENKWY